MSWSQSVRDWLEELEEELDEELAEELVALELEALDEEDALEEDAPPQEASIMQALKARRRRFFFICNSLSARFSRGLISHFNARCVFR